MWGEGLCCIVACVCVMYCVCSITLSAHITVSVCTVCPCIPISIHGAVGVTVCGQCCMYDVSEVGPTRVWCGV